MMLNVYDSLTILSEKKLEVDFVGRLNFSGLMIITNMLIMCKGCYLK